MPAVVERPTLRSRKTEVLEMEVVKSEKRHYETDNMEVWWLSDPALPLRRLS